MFNLIFLKRAVHYIPEKFQSVQFNQAETIIIDGQRNDEFEFAPEDYDYSKRCPIIDRAFAMYMAKPFFQTKTFTAKNNREHNHIDIIVRHDGAITFIGKSKYL